MSSNVCICVFPRYNADLAVSDAKRLCMSSDGRRMLNTAIQRAQTSGTRLPLPLGPNCASLSGPPMQGGVLLPQAVILPRRRAPSSSNAGPTPTDTGGRLEVIPQQQQQPVEEIDQVIHPHPCINIHKYVPFNSMSHYVIFHFYYANGI